jgi:hypothetical protein
VVDVGDDGQIADVFSSLLTQACLSLLSGKWADLWRATPSRGRVG